MSGRRLILGVELVCASLLLACSPPLAGQQEVPTFQGRCVGVTDGDSISVMQGSVSVRVRLDGFDEPELGQPFSQKSKQAPSENRDARSPPTLHFGRNVGIRGQPLHARRPLGRIDRTAGVPRTAGVHHAGGRFTAIWSANFTSESSWGS